MAIISPDHSMQDLKITYQESKLVFPSQQTQKKSLFLSNIDQFLNFNIQTAHFFKANPHFPPETAAKRLKMALEKVLVPYDFMAGRLNWNHHSCRLEIDCNAAGAGFVVASSEFSLDELGDLLRPNIGFRQLAVEKLRNLDDDKQPLCVFQVTAFKCGGFAIGVSLSHMLFDGLAAIMFQQNLASQAFDDVDNKPLALIPCHDRRLLAARSPPLVTFQHPEFLKLDRRPFLSPPPVSDDSEEKLDFRLLKLSSRDLNFLKIKASEAAAEDGKSTTAIKATTFNVAAALVWRCRALSARDLDHYKDRVSTILYVVDLRSRLNPPLPAGYCGNALLVAYASAKCEDIEKWPFWKMVEMVSQGVTRISDEYVKSATDFLEINKGMIPRGDCIVSSWLRLGYDQVEFPWGKPVCCTPVVNKLERIFWIFPDVDSDGVNVLVQRPAAEMETFQLHFHNFFAHNI
ncbi:hypothetical protein ABFS83_11G004300 [Erythranthe nasuta]